MRAPHVKNVTPIMLIPTRQDFAGMDWDEIYFGMTLRSAKFEKWVVEDPAEYDLSTLRSFKRAEFPTTAEKNLPKQFIITHGKRPCWVVREIH